MAEQLLEKDRQRELLAAEVKMTKRLVSFGLIFFVRNVRSHSEPTSAKKARARSET